MKLLISGKYIEINDYVELITENPLINNFDTQYAQYSNSFSVPYNGDIAEVIDVALLRKSATPYLITDAFLIDGLILIPVKILITEYDAIKNVVKLNVIERMIVAAGSIDIREKKLTELRHTLNQTYYPLDETEVDEIILSNGALDKRILTPYFAETEVISDTQTYPHALQPNNSCPRISLLKFCDFLSERYGVTINNAPDIDFFSNRQFPFSGDVVSATVDFSGINAADVIINPATLTDYPAGIKANGFLDLTTRQLTYRNRIADFDSRFLTCKITVTDIGYDHTKIRAYFKGTELTKIGVSGQEITFGIADPLTELSAFVAPSGSDADRVVAFRVTNTKNYTYSFYSTCRFYISMSGNNTQATDDNSRQVFRNMPDITVMEFFKRIAKASAMYLKITSEGVDFVSTSSSLVPTSIFDASQYFISASKVDYKLYDISSIEYWYKGADSATLTIPITDERVVMEPKKIEIDILRTDDANVILFEDDGIKPLEGVATFPFIDITDKAVDLANFYLAIQKPFVVTAKFRNFDVTIEKSLLIRQLNGLFVPKKIIKTNRDIIELELLKLEE